MEQIIEIKQHTTATTTDLGNWLNGKMVLYLNDLANPKIVLIYSQTRCSSNTLCTILKNVYLKIS